MISTVSKSDLWPREESMEVSALCIYDIYAQLHAIVDMAVIQRPVRDIMENYIWRLYSD